MGRCGRIDSHAGAARVRAGACGWGDAEPLSLNNPPQRSALFIPACSSGDDGYPCLLEDFVKAAGQAMAPDCLR